MQIKTQSTFNLPKEKPKMYLVSIVIESHVSWKFCMTVLTSIFHMSDENAQLLTDEIQQNGEAFCGVYMFEIAETKALSVETLAKKEGFSLCCSIEEV